MEEGHDVESDVAEETMSALVKLVKAITRTRGQAEESVGSSTGMQRTSADWLLDRARWCARREAQYRCLEVPCMCSSYFHD